MATLRDLVGAAEAETVAIASELRRLDPQEAAELAGCWAGLLGHATNMTLAAERLMDGGFCAEADMTDSADSHPFN